MKRFGLVALVFGIVAWSSLEVVAANWYVRPNGSTYGSGTGQSWVNAWNGFGGINWGSVANGDTIWVAGGTYSQDLKPNKTATASAPISIRRARSDAAECTGSSGWNSSFDSLITHRPGGIVFDADDAYIIISGKTTASGGIHSIKPVRGSQHGWLLSRSASTEGAGVEWAGGSDNCTIEFLELEGAGEINISGDMRAFDMTPSSGTASGNIISHCWAHDWESFGYCVGASSPIFEYCIVEDIAPRNTATFHPNGIITWGAPNGIVRYCVFRKGPHGLGCGEGIFFEQSGGSTGWQIYGNIFHDLDYSGVKAIEISSAVGAIKIFNNTFVNILVGTIYGSDSPSASGGEQRNNFVYKAGVSSVTGLTSSQNVTATSTAAFVDYASRDLHIVPNSGAGYARDVGAALSTAFNTDMDGHIRGADGAWDAGAFEYGITSPNAVIGVSPHTLDYGSVILGTSKDLTVTVQNSGGSQLAGSVAVSSPFSVLSGGSYTLGQGESQSVTLRFTPSSEGNSTTTAAFSGGGGATVSLIGIGTVQSTTPMIGVSPSSLNFGSVTVGGAKDLIVTVQNTGGGNLSGAATTSAPFSILAGGTYNLTQGQSQNVTIRFTPSVTASASGTMSLTGGGGATVLLSGSGVSAASGLTFAAASGSISSPFAVNNGFISQPSQTDLTGGGRATYAFTLADAGEYVLSINVDAPNDGSNSIFVNIDAEPTDPDAIWDVLPVTNGAETRLVGWRGSGSFSAPEFPIKMFNLAAGTHQLIIVGREGNTKLGTISVIAQPKAPQNLRIVVTP
jgi:hypothetical protein